MLGGVAKPKRPLSDDEVDMLVSEMCELDNASDQRALVISSLSRRTLTCQQACTLLKAGQAGMQRMRAFEVMQRHLTDLPDGMPHISEALSDTATQVRQPVAANGQLPSSQQQTKLPMSTAPPKSAVARLHAKEVEHAALLESNSALIERIDRLRAHAEGADLPQAFYEDLAATFEASGLAPLPAQTATSKRTAAVAAARSVRVASPQLRITSSQLLPGMVQTLLDEEDELDAQQIASLPPLHLVPTAMLLEAVQDQYAEGKLEDMLQDFMQECEAQSEESV